MFKPGCRHHVQHIALIFCEICTAFQAQPTVCMRTDARMVSSSDCVEPEFVGSLRESFEFKVPVAFDAWVEASNKRRADAASGARDPTIHIAKASGSAGYRVETTRAIFALLQQDGKNGSSAAAQAGEYSTGVEPPCFSYSGGCYF